MCVAGLPARAGQPTHPSDLASHDVLAYSLLSMGDQWEFTGSEGVVSVKVTPRMRTNSGDTCRAAALRAPGIVLQPTFLVGPDLLAGTLVEVHAGLALDRAGRLRGLPLAQVRLPKVRMMIEFLVNAFRMRAWPA